MPPSSKANAPAPQSDPRRASCFWLRNVSDSETFPRQKARSGSDSGARAPRSVHQNRAMSKLAGEIDDQLRAEADSDRATGEKAYLKSDRDFLGVSVPGVRKIIKQTLKAHGALDHDETATLADGLWSGEGVESHFFEHRRAAVEVMTARSDVLTVDDLPFVESLIRDGETWALVDPLAIDVCGAIVGDSASDNVVAVLDRWSVDPESFWVRRASMLALLRPLRASDADWERFCGYADEMMDEREFFIRKAIGWVLRDISKRRPVQVRAWVEPRLESMSGVTRREAVKYL
jgi:3-methyladenine DNA glycosylase AlkD